MAFDALARATESSFLDSANMHSDPVSWKAYWSVEKNWKADDADHKAGDREFHAFQGNLLMNGGASIIWRRLITRNPSTSSTGAALQAFSTGNTRLAVGNSTASAAVTQNTLQGGSVRYNGMSAGYPSHTDGTSSSGARQVQFRAVFTTAQANFAWNEWGVFNSSGASRRMLNRRVQSLGTKTSSAQWTFTVTLALS